MSILVFAEQRKKKLRKAAREAVSKGKALADQLGEKVAVVLIGTRLLDLIEEVKRYGPDEIYLADDPALELYQTESYAWVFEEVIKKANPTLILMAHSSMAKDLAPRVAQRIEAGLLTDCIDVRVGDNRELSFLRPVYAGKALALMKIATRVKFATLRPNLFPPVEKAANTEIKKLNISLPPPRARTREVSILEEEGPELTEADIIVSGGRGLGDPKGFDLLRRLARLLDAAVGASRAAVDAGWANQQQQVGQTGKVVSPKLYIALGISGAIQHIAGMGTSKCIVAVNKDPEANIFNIADYGIVGDLYELVPILIYQLEKIKDVG